MSLDRTLALLSATPGWDAVADAAGIDDAMVAQVLEAAGRLADDVVAPLNADADRGCRVDHGRVVVPDGFTEAYRAVADGGWIGLDLPPDLGGAGLPITLQALTAQLFDRACPAFAMATGASRSAAHLIAEAAPHTVARDWVPALIDGSRAATICISEPQAGSDLGRITTKARRDGATWRIDGQKSWISFGDHSMTGRIGHCMLARTSDAPGTRGLSLFLCPNRKADGAPNGVEVTGIERKLGLHGAPTCGLAFDDAEAVLLGMEGRGLPQLFTMISLMRLQVGGQGLAAATKACEIAEGYAAERWQGGPADAAPVPIDHHPDVRRQLAAMRSRTEVLRAAVLELAVQLDLARCLPDAAGRAEAKAQAAWLMPLIKTAGAETGFDVASAGIQVLGGAGYTADWPLEQTLRDTRILSIYEGTTGMQAIDFLERRLVADRSGFDAICGRMGGGDVPRRLAKTADRLLGLAPEARLDAADTWLRLAWLGVTAWLAPRAGLPAPHTAEFAALEARLPV